MPLIPDDKQLIKAAKRRTRPGKPVKPSKSEEYQLKRLMSQLWKEVLLPATQRIKDLIKQDASPMLIAQEIENTLLQAQMTYGRRVNQIVDKWVLGVDREVQNAIHRTMEKALGIDVTGMLQQPEIAGTLEGASMQAALLIKTIPQDYLGQVARSVNDNFNGRDLPEGRTLIQQIQHLGGVSYRRAKLISRDQTTKLTAALNQHRQQAVGITMFVWRTVKDQRVVGNPVGVSPVGNQAHGDHFHMNEFYFRWDDNTVYSDDRGKTWKKRPQGWSHGNPGEDIECRCHAEPVIDPKKIIEFATARKL